MSTYVTMDAIHVVISGGSPSTVDSAWTVAGDAFDRANHDDIENGAVVRCVVDDFGLLPDRDSTDDEADPHCEIEVIKE